MLVRTTTLLFALAAAACGATMRVPLLPPRHVPPRTDLALAVAPLGDARPHERVGKGAWLLVPLVPWDTSEEARPDEDRVAASSPEHFRAQVRDRLAEQLAAAGIFARVDTVDGPRVDPARYPLVLTGELRASLRRERRTAYGLSLAGMALWLAGAPMGWNRIEWELAVELRDARTGHVLKAIEARREETRWTGLYWGGSGFPDGEAEALRPMLADVLAEIDAALESVPELAALVARPVQPSRAAPAPARRIGLAGRTVLVLAVPRVEVVQALAELVCAEVERQTGARVLGTADLDAMLGLQKQRELVGCTDEDCFVDVIAALRPDHVLGVSVARIGPDQVLTLKVIDPKTTTVSSRTSWTATGTEPSAFVTRLPDIVGEALRPLAGGQGSGTFATQDGHGRARHP